VIKIIYNLPQMPPPSGRDIVERVTVLTVTESPLSIQIPRPY